MQFTIKTRFAQSAWTIHRDSLRAERSRLWDIASAEIRDTVLPWRTPDDDAIRKQIDKRLHAFEVFGVYREIRCCDNNIRAAERQIADYGMLVKAGVTEVVVDIDEFRTISDQYTLLAEGERRAYAA